MYGKTVNTFIQIINHSYFVNTKIYASISNNTKVYDTFLHIYNNIICNIKILKIRAFEL